MKWKWDVDDTTIVEAKFGGLWKNFSKTVLTINGRDIPNSVRPHKKSEFAFELPNSQTATLSVTPRPTGVFDIDLRVDGRLMAPITMARTKCPSCKAAVKAYHLVCAQCGRELHTAENYEHEKRLQEAMNPLWVAAGVGCIYGVIMLLIAPWRVAIVDLVLAAVLAGVALSGKRVPHAAFVVATALYVLGIIAGTIIGLTPSRLNVILRIVLLGYLIKGTKGAWAVRSPNA